MVMAVMILLSSSLIQMVTAYLITLRPYSILEAITASMNLRMAKVAAMLMATLQVTLTVTITIVLAIHLEQKVMVVRLMNCLRRALTHLKMGRAAV